MEKFEINLLKEKIAYAGETASGNFSAGYCNIYSVEAESKKWKVELAHTFWENGEEEVAAKSINPESLSIIKNRLRLVVSNCEMKDFH